jgi:hypothetical protein
MKSYTLVTFVFLIPRAVFQSIAEDNYNILISAYFMIYATGIVYTLIFIQERRDIAAFELMEDNIRNSSVDPSSDIINSKHFEFEEEPDTKPSSNQKNVTNNPLMLA